MHNRQSNPKYTGATARKDAGVHVSKIFAGKRILVTGHTGFKGSWLCIWLEALGAEVSGYALDPISERDNFVVSGVEKRVRHHVGDIRDFDRLSGLVSKIRPEVVFHLAAQPIVLDGYHRPKETFDINVGGTVNLLECCRQSDTLRVVVNVTSDKCYENRDRQQAYGENDRLGGYDPYSASKSCSEMVTSAYRNAYFHPDRLETHGKSVSTARAGNVIGGGDWQNHRILPDCIRALENGETIRIRHPRAKRPWQHVLEPLSGYLCLAERMLTEPGVFSGAWNFGPAAPSVVPVGEVVQRVIGCWGSGRWMVEEPQADLHEAALLSLDISKAQSLLGWHPAWDLDKAVGHTVDWYKTYRDKAPHAICMAQISDYENATTGLRV